MTSTKNNSRKNIMILASPILLFFVLLIPYSWINQAFLVDWFGCGCPKIDAYGNIIHPTFNANVFTSLFWHFITLCTTVISFILSKRIPKEKMRIRILYVISIFVMSLFITYQFCQMMMWN